jgi:hypothetical protein
MYVHETYPRTSAENKIDYCRNGGVARCETRGQRRLVRMGQAAGFKEETSRRMVCLLGKEGAETIGRSRT